MKEVLIIIPYTHIYPAMNGGMQRCINILHQLAKYFKVTAIINQDAESFSKAVMDYPALADVDVYSTMHSFSQTFATHSKFFRIKNALQYRWIKRSMFATTDSNFMLYYPIINSLLKHKKFDVVVIENLDSLNAVSVVRKHDKNLCVIYDAHNVDTVLAEASYSKGETSEKRVNRIRVAEESIYKKANAVIACSKIDLEVLQQMNKAHLKGAVVPNGTNTSRIKFDNAVHDEASCTLLFCGTLWSVANLEGLHWFYQNVWPLLATKFRSLELIVLGSGEPPDSLEKMRADSKVIFTGSVQDVKPWYNKAAVSIVPLLTGSGTRLKILEAMGLGVPVISTSIGAEGIGYTHQTNVVIADSATDFARELTALLGNVTKRLKLAQQARILVEEKYDWNVIGRGMADFIDNAR